MISASTSYFFMVPILCVLHVFIIICMVFVALIMRVLHFVSCFAYFNCMLLLCCVFLCCSVHCSCPMDEDYFTTLAVGRQRYEASLCASSYTTDFDTVYIQYQPDYVTTNTMNDVI